MMKVLFKCKCITEDASVEVRFREQDEDIADWMHEVQTALGEAHRLMSPRCYETRMEYAKFFAPENAPGIGMKPEFNS